MNPIEAMAKAIYAESVGEDGCWEVEPDHEQSRWRDIARAAKDALADNVDGAMLRAWRNASYNSPKITVCVAAAIRAAGEE